MLGIREPLSRLHDYFRPPDKEISLWQQADHIKQGQSPLETFLQLFHKMLLALSFVKNLSDAYVLNNNINLCLVNWNNGLYVH